MKRSRRTITWHAIFGGLNLAILVAWLGSAIGGKITAMVLMHVVTLGLIPLLVVRLTTIMIANRDAFTHEEQLQMQNDLAFIRAQLIKNGDDHE